MLPQIVVGQFVFPMWVSARKRKREGKWKRLCKWFCNWKYTDRERKREWGKFASRVGVARSRFIKCYVRQHTHTHTTRLYIDRLGSCELRAQRERGQWPYAEHSSSIGHQTLTKIHTRAHIELVTVREKERRREVVGLSISKSLPTNVTP